MIDSTGGTGLLSSTLYAGFTTAVCWSCAFVVLAGRRSPRAAGRRSRPARASSPVLTTVIDAQGRLVPNLDREEFTILDNGKPQAITFFQNETQPFTAVVMLDFSASMTANLDLLKRATEQFILRMLPDDKAQVGAFSDKIQFSGTFTSDRDDLIGALKDLQFGNPTRLYDAIDASIDMLKVSTAAKDRGDLHRRRRHGEPPRHGRRASRSAKAKETMIYAIGLESEFSIGPGGCSGRDPDRGLRKLADETGGGYFELKKTDDLAPTFTRVAQELHSLYTLGFTPTVLDGKEHKLDVQVKQPATVARRARATSPRENGSRSQMTRSSRSSGCRPIERSRTAARTAAAGRREGFEVELQNGVLQVSSRIRRPRNSSSVQTRRSGRSGCRPCRAATSWRGRMTPPHSRWTARRSRLSSSASRACICRRRPPRPSSLWLIGGWLPGQLVDALVCVTSPRTHR